MGLIDLPCMDYYYCPLASSQSHNISALNKLSERLIFLSQRKYISTN